MNPDDDQYISSEDSDFAPDEAPDGASEASESQDDAGHAPSHDNRPRPGVEQGDDAGYDNSGDEAIIEKGHRRIKRAKQRQGDGTDGEDGEGGLIKTRRQRAAEKEERRYATRNEAVTVDIDAIWRKMMSGTLPATRSPPSDGGDDNDDGQTTKETGHATLAGIKRKESGMEADASGMVRIKRKYNFAGQTHTEEKLVPRESAEAKLFLASNSEDAADQGGALPTKRITKRAFRSAFEPQAGQLPQRQDLNLGLEARLQASRDAQAKKLNTVEKSRMDWAAHVDREGIKNELELAGRSKGSYAAREDFLARSEAKRAEDAKKARMAARA